MSDATRSETATPRSTWWRWPLVPIAAIVAGMAGGAVMTGFQWLGVKMNWGSTEGWYFVYLVPLFAAGAFGYAFSAAAFGTAPFGKSYATTVMITLLGVLGLIDIVLVWSHDSFTVSDAIRSTLQSIVAPLAAVIYLLDKHN